MFKSFRFTILFVVSVPLLLFFSSCGDDFDPLTELKGNREDIKAMLKSDDIVQKAVIDSDNFTFQSNSRVAISAEPNSFEFTDNGALATGLIDFEMTELFTKSEILQYGIPTQTSQSILESDGEFLFKASQNGRSLKLVNDKLLYVMVPDPEPNQAMELFVEGEEFWRPTSDFFNVLGFDDGPAGFKGYEFNLDNLEWVNIDYFTKFDRELTDITFCLPDGYEDDKITLWVVFKDIDIVLSSNGENLPLGEVVSIVCIAAEDEDTFRIDIEEIIIEEDLKVDLDPKEESAERIKVLLKELD